ncbi:hypothetical protein BDR26DRAFT_949401 [Obelidium mucronatum]|nr:hypothetical protein BDR26DRAFT_949401 [Obelidium mucronatum]
MPTYQVLRCFAASCNAFQVQQEKKTRKWSCLMCGAKQSVLKVFFESTSPAECRPIVQDLNMRRGQAAEFATVKASELNEAAVTITTISTNNTNKEEAIKRKSKWAVFVAEEEEGLKDDSTANDSSMLSFEHPSESRSRGKNFSLRGKRSATAAEGGDNSGAKRRLLKNPSEFVGVEDQLSLKPIGGMAGGSTRHVQSVVIPPPTTVPQLERQRITNVQLPPAPMAISTNDIRPPKPRNIDVLPKSAKWGAFIDEEEREEESE